jgi:hypothetical protein
MAGVSDRGLIPAGDRPCRSAGRAGPGRAAPRAEPPVAPWHQRRNGTGHGSTSGASLPPIVPATPRSGGAGAPDRVRVRCSMQRWCHRATAGSGSRSCRSAGRAAIPGRAGPPAVPRLGRAAHPWPSPRWHRDTNAASGRVTDREPWRPCHRSSLRPHGPVAPGHRISSESGARCSVGAILPPRGPDHGRAAPPAVPLRRPCRSAGRGPVAPAVPTPRPCPRWHRDTNAATGGVRTTVWTRPDRATQPSTDRAR